ncbi:MAG: hypothetical protein JWQ35_2008 [Bacteriovoracaceae bacterium]|nr:hypothetical protein [Bacteriovoracaceae bacterium]
MDGFKIPFPIIRNTSFTTFFIGVLSLLLYISIYFTQRALFFCNTEMLEWACFYYLLYFIQHLVLFYFYGWILHLAKTTANFESSSFKWLLIFPVLFQIVLLFGLPTLSIDLFSYAAQGQLSILPHTSVYQTPLWSFPNGEFKDQLLKLGWIPINGLAPYGPLFIHIESLVARLTSDVYESILIFKLIIIAANFLAIGLIWQILKKINPTRRWLGLLIYLWNPLVIIEVASEGHNDPIMLSFLLLSLLGTFEHQRAKAWFGALLAFLSKYISVIFIPAQAIFFWRTEKNRKSLLCQILIFTMISLGFIYFLYAPFWVGTKSFKGLLSSLDISYDVSISGLMYSMLTHFLNAAIVSTLISWTLRSIFIFFVFKFCIKIKTESDLVAASVKTALLFTLFLAPNFWAWYAIVPIALISISAQTDFMWAAFLLSFCARITAASDILVLHGILDLKTQRLYSTLFGVILPLLFFIWIGVRANRPTYSHEYTN